MFFKCVEAEQSIRAELYCGLKSEQSMMTARARARARARA